MEARTCEEYVLNELESLKKENELLKNINDSLDAMLTESDQELCELQNLVDSLIEVHDATDDRVTLWFRSCIFSDHDSEIYNSLISLVPKLERRIKKELGA